MPRSVETSIVGLVRVHLGGTRAPLPRRPPDRRDRVEQRLAQDAIMAIGTGEPGRQRHALAVDGEVVWRPQCAPLPADLTVHLDAGCDSADTRESLAEFGDQGEITPKGTQVALQQTRR